MSGKKLLVADDSLTIQKVIRLALSNEGYEIQAISDGSDAIQQIATFRPDVVLIDVSLPTRTAFEIKREANSMPDHQGIKFILMSSAFEKIDENQAAEVGFDGRLTKPFDPAHLRQTLNEVVQVPASPKEFPTSSIPIQFDPPSPTLSSGLPLEMPTELPPELPPELSPELPNDELWGKHEEPTLPPVPPQMESGSDDIKSLTESTIRMSGLAEVPNLKPEEFEWQVNEPSLKPPSSFADTGGSSFQSHPAQPPSFQPEFTPPPLPVQQPPSDTTRASGSAFSGGDIEEIVRRQVQETLEKMAQRILPEVAERVIKAEISRLLNEKV